MCIGTFSVEHPDYALILAANRDEVLDRPTEHARFRRSFKDHVEAEGHAEPDILCGLDLQAGGTWLGLSKSSGSVTFLTNISEPPGTYELSRGYLVSSLLLPSSSGTESHPIQEGIQHLLGLKSRFAGFNLLVFVPRFSKSAHGPEGSWELSYEATKLSNNGGGNPIVSRTLTSEERKGGAMSNGIDGKGGDEWPKVKDATKSLRELLTRDGAELKEGSSSGGKPDEELAEELFHILSQCHHKGPSCRYELRNTIQVIPFTLSPEDPGTDESPHQLGTSCPNDFYGTMLSTVILVKRNGEVLFIERDIWGHDMEGVPVRSADRATDRVFRFNLAVAPL